MKKGILLTIALATASLFATAQQLIPDGGFDNWTSNTDIGNWSFVSGARGSLSSAGLQVDGKTLTAHHGADALVLQNNANISIASQVFPINSRPSTLQGAFGYFNSVGTERFIIVVTMTKWDAINMKRDTIINNGVASGPQQGFNAWNLIQWNIAAAYQKPDVPDSCRITIFCSAITNPVTATPNTILVVDALNLNNTSVGVPMLVTPILEASSYPNPAFDKATISYSLPSTTNVEVTITDITGKTVATVFSGEQTQGRKELDVDVSRFNPGIYFYTIKAGNAVETRKMIVTK